eukprot:506531-Prymnesium_polylepis.1
MSSGLLDHAIGDAEDAHGGLPAAALEDVAREHGGGARPKGVAICIGPPPSVDPMPGHPRHALVHLALGPLVLHPPALPHQLVEESLRRLEHCARSLRVSSLCAALRDRLGQQLLDFTAAQQIVEDGTRCLEATCFEEKIRQLRGAVGDRLLTRHFASRSASQLLLRLVHLVVILERGHLAEHGPKSGTLCDTHLDARLLRSRCSRQLLGCALSGLHVRCAMRGSILFTLHRDSSRVHTAFALGPQRDPAAGAREEELETAPFPCVQKQLHTQLSILRQRGVRKGKVGTSPTTSAGGCGTAAAALDSVPARSKLGSTPDRSK